MSNNYSDLQVVPHDENPKFLVPSSNESKEDHDLPEAFPQKLGANSHPFDEHQRQPEKKRICGLSAKIFWILVAVAIVIVIAAAVGGGVGGSLSSSHNKELTDAQPSSSSPISSLSRATSSVPLTKPSTTGTPTTSEAVVSTSTTQSAEYTLLVDCPSSNWTVYTPPGTSQMFRKMCQTSVTNDDNGINNINIPTPDLDSCIGLCAAYNVQNATQIAAGASAICNAVCWRDTIQDDDYPGQCFGFSTQNTTGNFALTGDSRCAGAVLINQ